MSLVDQFRAHCGRRQSIGSAWSSPEQTSHQQPTILLVNKTEIRSHFLSGQRLVSSDHGLLRTFEGNFEDPVWFLMKALDFP
jgi:hypothetical protein